ncbi:metal-dependent hydrolase [Photobacterium ganghwense]|uniref:Hydrolase n=1 Tax=Photobacterium ganghwense TaxID=320778 RepID=A0A0J1HIH8_9GAMM|nr:metal-dependent hydrolase [Photobacterium ganghwense]KLV11421.1 hydrolase [Photobacterium ganghwense]MBV1841692.1 metal-dependent hydrolase [Photobacterium ganghwense]PSU08275.1 metal-dependent hydrolase [Photobacterium ganghwense]QSV15086.1 metal-dependent hydrolase [Photobacterium ganghwense]
MDSVTQAALGAAVAGMIAGRNCSPKVLLAGAALGTLPDLDVLISYGDPVSDMVNHRGFSHSLLVLLPFSFLLSWIWQTVKPTRMGLPRLWLLVAACLITHPLLDAFTSYGTQLLWPLALPVAISSIFIIDPLYTVPLLVCLAASLMWRDKMAHLCRVGVAISSVYLIWSLVAYSLVSHRVETQLADTPLAERPVFITPTPFNTLLWRVVVHDGAYYWEGLTSLLDKNTEVDFIAKNRGHWPIEERSNYLQMIERFSAGFVKYEQRDNTLVVTDLRLGILDYMPFQFSLAQQDEAEEWLLTDPVQLPTPPVKPKHLPALWLRLLGNQDIDANLCHVSECPHPVTFASN